MDEGSSLFLSYIHGTTYRAGTKDIHILQHHASSQRTSIECTTSSLTNWLIELQQISKHEWAAIQDCRVVAAAVVIYLDKHDFTSWIQDIICNRVQDIHIKNQILYKTAIFFSLPTLPSPPHLLKA